MQLFLKISISKLVMIMLTFRLQILYLTNKATYLRLYLSEKLFSSTYFFFFVK